MVIQDLPMVSVVINSFNNCEVLKECLESVLETSYPAYEVIVVDNLSNDGTVEMLQNFGDVKNLRVIRPPRRVGAAEGRNLGIEHSGGRYLAFLDSDVTTDPDWLMELVRVLEQNRLYGAAQAKICRTDDPPIWRVGEFVDKYVTNFVVLRSPEPGNKIRRIFSPIGAAMIFRSSVLRMIEGFDSELVVYHEDVDIGWRTWLAGYEVVFVPGSVVYHKGGRTLSRLAKETQMFHETKNRIVMIIKNYTLKNGVQSLVITLLSVLGRALYRRDSIIILVLIKASIWNARNFRSSWTKRLGIQRRRAITDEYLFETIMKNVPSALHVIIGSSRSRKMEQRVPFSSQ